MTTKKATATVNATANNTTTTTATVKPTAMHTVTDVHELFVKAVGTAPLKVNFSDGKQSYTGRTDFSVNFKRSLYRVYMSAENAAICTGIDNTLTVTPAPHDTKSGARDVSIVFTADKYDTLKKCIDSVIAAAVKRVNAANAAKAKTAKPAKTKKPATAEKPATVTA